MLNIASIARDTTKLIRIIFYFKYFNIIYIVINFKFNYLLFNKTLPYENDILYIILYLFIL